jgi:UPF0716 protein FxsA
MPQGRSRGPWALFGLAILIVPFIEIVILVRLGQAIGAGWTVLILVADAVLGAWLVRKEGRRAWEALVSAFSTGRMPGKELADAALILIGGTLLITPGFVTDAVGLVCVLPMTRPLARRLLGRMVSQRVRLVGTPFGSAFPGGYGPSARPDGADPTVIRGDVVEDE